MPPEPPEGYVYTNFFLQGSNVRSIMVLACKRCGAIVALPYAHNEYHIQEDRRADQIRPFLPLLQRGDHLKLDDRAQCGAG